MTKLLIDECLSAELALMARLHGHHEASHVVWIGKAGWKDWELKTLILDEGWTFVTKNSDDFRGPSEAPGSRGQFADVKLHGGLICLNGPVGMDLDLQNDLFQAALEDLDRDQEMTNQVLEVTLPQRGTQIEVVRYALPQD